MVPVRAARDVGSDVAARRVARAGVTEALCVAASRCLVALDPARTLRPEVLRAVVDRPDAARDTAPVDRAAVLLLARDRLGVVVLGVVVVVRARVAPVRDVVVRVVRPVAAALVERVVAPRPLVRLAEAVVPRLVAGVVERALAARLPVVRVEPVVRVVFAPRAVAARADVVRPLPPRVVAVRGLVPRAVFGAAALTRVVPRAVVFPVRVRPEPVVAARLGDFALARAVVDFFTREALLVPAATRVLRPFVVALPVARVEPALRGAVVRPPVPVRPAPVRRPPPRSAIGCARLGLSLLSSVVIVIGPSSSIARCEAGGRLRPQQSMRRLFRPVAFRRPGRNA